MGPNVIVKGLTIRLTSSVHWSLLITRTKTPLAPVSLPLSIQPEPAASHIVGMGGNGAYPNGGISKCNCAWWPTQLSVRKRMDCDLTHRLRVIREEPDRFALQQIQLRYIHCENPKRARPPFTHRVRGLAPWHNRFGKDR